MTKGNLPELPKGYYAEPNGWTLEVYKDNGEMHLGMAQYVLVAEMQRDDESAEVRLQGERFYDHQFRSVQAAADFIVARTR